MNLRAARRAVAALLSPALLTAGIGRPPALLAHEVQQVTVARQGERYRVEMSVRLDVTAERAYAVFSDPDRLRLTNSSIRTMTASDDPDSRPDHQRMSTDVRLCAGLFCRNLHQVQDMRFDSANAPATYRIIATVLPALSDLRYGEARWTFTACGEARHQTCLRFAAELEPEFWVPPLIGPWLIERTLREQALQTSAGIERIARQLDTVVVTPKEP